MTKNQNRQHSEVYVFIGDNPNPSPNFVLLWLNISVSGKMIILLVTWLPRLGRDFYQNKNDILWLPRVR